MTRHIQHWGGQIGNLGLYGFQRHFAVLAKPATGIAHLHAGLVEHQLARQLGDQRPRGLARSPQAGRHVVIDHIAHRRGNVEHAFAATGVKRKLRQRPCHLEAHIAGRAAAHAVAHIVARVLRNLQRQVAVHTGPIGAGKYAVQGQIAGQAMGGIGPHLPAGGEVALGIGIGKLGLGDLNGPAAGGILAPAHAGMQLVDRDARLLKNAGELQRTLAHVHIGRAALLIECEAQSSTFQARRMAAGLLVTQRHTLQLPLGVVAQRVAAHRGLPAQLQRFGLALQLPALQLRLCVGRQRQALGHAAGQCQVQVAGFQRMGHIAAGQGPAHGHIAGRPVGAVGQGKSPARHPGLPATVQRLQVQPTGYLLQIQRRLIALPVHPHLGQVQIGRHAGQRAFAHIGPSAEVALCLHLLHPPFGGPRQVRHLLHSTLGKPLALPTLPGLAAHRQHRLLEIAHHLQRPAPLGLGLLGVHAQRMAPMPVAQHQVHIFQLLLGRAAQRVVPAQHTMADGNLGLVQHPFQRAAVWRSIVLLEQARHLPAPVGAAPHIQLGGFHDDLLHPPAPQRAGRNGHHHLRQLQGRPALGVLQLHIFQLQAGHQTVGIRHHGADVHRYPQGLSGQLFQLGAVVPDSRHNESMEHPGRGREQQPEGQQPCQRPPRHHCCPVEQA